MEHNSILMFIGEVVGNREIRITKKISIHDAIIFLDKSFPTFPSSMDKSYQSILLEERADILIHLNHYNILLSYQRNSLQIVETSNFLTEEEVWEVFTSFIVRIGDKLTYLGNFPYSKARCRKRKKGPTLTGACHHK